MPRPTPLPLRRALARRAALGQDGHTIADALGLAPRTARRLLRRLRLGGPPALRPSYRRPPPPSDTPLCQAALALRRQHPTWGAPLIRVLLGHDFPPQALPSARTLQRWFRAHGLAPAPKGRRPRAHADRAAHPHDAWQIDAAEHVLLANGQRVSWLRVVDEHTGAVLGTRVFLQASWPSVGDRPVQAELRRLFRLWGRPKALRVDNGTPWGSKGDLPTDLCLWLAGLGVAVWHNPPRRPDLNGVVERMQGVGKSWGEPHACGSAEELQARLEQMDHIQRAEYPSCRGQSRLAAHPGLAHSGRPYSRAWEGRSFSREAALEYLAAHVVPRRVSSKGMLSVYDRSYYVGSGQRGQVVYVLLDPLTGEWVCADAQDRQLRRWPAPELSRQRLLQLRVSRRRS